MNLDQGSYILVKVAHEIVDVVEKVELPAFFDQRITKQVMESNGTIIVIGRW